jgi:flavin-dependent dehydrogenase
MGSQAVVIGGGLAGLAAAGVLARHFTTVTVIESLRPLRARPALAGTADRSRGCGVLI